MMMSSICQNGGQILSEMGPDGRGRGLTLQGAPMRPTLLQRLARNEDEEEEEEAGYLADLHL